MPGGTDQARFRPDQWAGHRPAVNMNAVSAFGAVRDNYPVLAQAAESCASYQLRTRATIVGNICNASPAGGHNRGLPPAGWDPGCPWGRWHARGTIEFFLPGAGQAKSATGDIVTALRLPAPPKGLIGTYIKYGRNKISDLASWE